jgi:hypothetical protein
LPSSILVRVALASVFAVLAVVYVKSFEPRGSDVAIVGAPYPVGGREIVKVTYGVASSTPPLPLDTTTVDGVTTTRVHLDRLGTYAITITSQDGSSADRNVDVRSVSWLIGAALLFLVLAIMLPYALKGGGGAWSELLSEKAGGLSLSRVQLLIWFLPTAVLYGALSFTLHRFVDVTTQLAVLLGLSGATTLLGTATSPPPPPASTNAASSELQDLVTDWSNQPDVSRYQCLLLSLVGATIMVAAFWRQLEFPQIPAAFVYLLAGSQGTYVATKAVKASKTTPEASPAAVVRPAPATMTPTTASTATATGSFTPNG